MTQEFADLAFSTVEGDTSILFAVGKATIFFCTDFASTTVCIKRDDACLFLFISVARAFFATACCIAAILLGESDAFAPVGYTLTFVGTDFRGFTILVGCGSAYTVVGCALAQDQAGPASSAVGVATSHTQAILEGAKSVALAGELASAVSFSGWTATGQPQPTA